ncbi:MAG: FG-GAP-like repeat-containing protein, partial [Acidobacteriota bacterium]
MRKSTTRIVGLVVSLALGAATYAQQAQEYQVTVFVQQSGVDDRGQITVGARVAATDGFDSSLDLADPHAPAWPHSYLDLVTVHQKTDPGWASQALQAMAYRRDFIAIHGLSARTFAMTLRADSGTPTTLSWFPLDPASGIAPFNVTLHEGGSAVDMWTATSYTWSPTATETPISIELTPGRATAPVAYNQTIVINEDSGGVVVTLKSQDWDECEMASFEIFNAPTFGSVGPVQPRPCTPGVPNVDTAFITYTPNPNVAGGDAFSFKVTDGSGATSFAVVSIDIVAINDAPFAPDSSFTLDEDAPTNVLLEAVDPDQQGQLYTIVMAPAHGTVSAPPSFPVLSTTVVYTPDRNYIGPDVFTWKCNDGAVDSNAAAVTLTVNPIDGPVAILSLQPAKAGIGDPVLADASASFHRFPPKGIAKYAFAFGDGFSYEETAASAPDGAFDGKTTHAYSALGTYTVALTVTDDASPPVSDTMTANATIVGVDVAIQDVDAGGIQYDGQALTVSGLARATVRNLSALDVLRPFDVRFFEDRNGNGVYDAGTDASLGLATVAAPLLFSESRVVAAPVSGSVLFSGNRVFAFVDSGNALTEVHEENNVAGSGSLCKVFGATQTFAPQQRFLAQAADLNTTLSGSDVASAVVDLNGDGVKDIVWLGIDPQTGFTPWGNLVAASGVDGTELWHREQDDVPARGFPATAVAVAQLDSDPEPELVITRAFGAGVTVFEHDGSLKWTFSENGFATAVTEVAIADLDADGTPEIVIDRNVVNADGSIRWHGALPANGNGTLESTVVDLDLDGKPEVLAGGMAYRADGTLLFESPALLPHDGYESLSSAIPGNFDDDPFPELVLSVMNRGEVWLLDHEGNPIWGPVTMPDLFGQRRVGSATVGDIDGDGKPEIAVASWEQLRIIEHDGTTKWTHAIDDGSSGSCHATFFDLDGDGSVEVLFADQTSFWIFRGNDGAVLFQGTRSSHTGEDQVVVTDLDGDGHAEVLVGHNSQVLSDNGVQVLEAGPGHEWVAARPTWNQ